MSAKSHTFKSRGWSLDYGNDYGGLNSTGFCFQGEKHPAGLEEGFNVLPAHAGDMFDGDGLGADSLALSMVGAVSKTFQVHLLNHLFHSLFCLNPALGKQGQLGDFC